VHDCYAGPYRDRPLDNRNPGRENQQYLNCNRQKGKGSCEAAIEIPALSGHGENETKPHHGTDNCQSQGSAPDELFCQPANERSAHGNPGKSRRVGHQLPITPKTQESPAVPNHGCHQSRLFASHIRPPTHNSIVPRHVGRPTRSAVMEAPISGLNTTSHCRC